MVTKLDKIAENVVQLLEGISCTVATAESCTGGLLSGAITSVSGASDVFGYGACTYANEAKMKLLGVKGETLEKHGAVSCETAEEMAEGIRRLSGAGYGVSTTGIAGPSGATEDKPVGTVCIGISSEKGTYAHRFVFDGEMFKDTGDKRTAIRLEAVYTALTLLKKEIENHLH